MDPQFFPDGVHPILDQQQQLLYPSPFPQNAPLSSYTIAEQIELGGARVEDTLHRLNCHYQFLFFLASWCVICASSFGIIYALFHFEIATFIDCIFLFIFGCATLVLDIPGNPRWAGRYRKLIRKYARLLTRITGKSLWLLYLGCMILVCLWPSNYEKASSFFLFLTMIISFIVNCIGSLGLFVALRKSLRLERVRKSLINTYNINWPDIYRKYAVNDPAHGMQFDEFNRMASDYSYGKLMFDLSDLQIIYNALDDHQKNAINEVEFGQWVSIGLIEDGDPCSCFNRYFSVTYL